MAPPRQPRKKEEVKILDGDSRNLFSTKSKSKIPNMLTDGGLKKEFMNTMFIEGENKNRQQQEEKSLESELPWFDGNKGCVVDAILAMMLLFLPL